MVRKVSIRLLNFSIRILNFLQRKLNKKVSFEEVPFKERFYINTFKNSSRGGCAGIQITQQTWWFIREKTNKNV